MKHKFLLLLFFPVFVSLYAAPLHSPTWGFTVDLPIGYVFVDGNGRDIFSFVDISGAQFDMRIYHGTYRTIEELTIDVNRRLQNRGETEFFYYNGKSAALIELDFGNISGWALAVELAPVPHSAAVPMLLALSYGPADRDDLNLLHMSALDSIAPSAAERFYPGPIIQFGFPRGEARLVPLAMPGLSAVIHENDAEAAQILIEREFAILTRHFLRDDWQEAWARYYRMIHRDSWTRIADAVFQLERHWNVHIKNPEANVETNPENADRAFAEKALAWVQTFVYERHTTESDFINLVTAVTEGRGDCDSRAMLWAIILAQANIESAIMVSRNHGHAMGLANIAGTGARFEAGGIRWLVAETTANVRIGLIDQAKSDIGSWLAILFGH